MSDSAEEQAKKDVERLLELYPLSPEIKARIFSDAPEWSSRRNVLWLMHQTALMQADTERGHSLLN